MQKTEPSAAAQAKQVAHAGPAVERWLSWSGLIPLPAFLVLHLSRELWLAFATDLSDVLRPAASLAVSVTAWVLVWIPLAVHLGLASWCLLAGRRLQEPVIGEQPAALPLFVSRCSSVVALAFIVYHAREYPLAAWLGEAAPTDAGFRLVSRLSAVSFGVPLRGGFYLVGLLATLAHAGLSVHRALARRGLLDSAQRRRVSARACAACAVALFSVGAAAVIRVGSGVLLP